MECKLIQIVSLAAEKQEGKGLAYVPTQVSKDEVVNVSPYLTSAGKLYKNVSVIERNNGSFITVVGNYSDLREQFLQNKVVRGFKRY